MYAFFPQDMVHGIVALPEAMNEQRGVGQFSISSMFFVLIFLNFLFLLVKASLLGGSSKWLMYRACAPLQG